LLLPPVRARACTSTSSATCSSQGAGENEQKNRLVGQLSISPLENCCASHGLRAASWSMDASGCCSMWECTPDPTGNRVVQGECSPYAPQTDATCSWAAGGSHAAGGANGCIIVVVHCCVRSRCLAAPPPEPFATGTPLPKAVLAEVRHATRLTLSSL
jgi:hypothetical protein